MIGGVGMSTAEESLHAAKSFGPMTGPGGLVADVFTDKVLLGSAFRDDYQSASPWPHMVLEGLIDPALIAAAEEQELEPGLNLEVERRVRMVKAQSPEPSGPAAKSILSALCTTQFISFLEDVTGIANLIADPTHYWTGLHVSPPGAYQAIHRDFRLHPVTGLFHRLTVLVYLNSDWKAEYGGELELWRSDQSACERQVAPEAGRVVIFGTTYDAIHGISDPIRCPDGRARLSLASDYYTASPGPGDRREPRLRRPKRPTDPWYSGYVTPRDGIDTLRRTIERWSTNRAGT
jgi:Rps23 Pro-64 3,4-dihydroxylase Tpa1-like proline 4-hydroxylase